MRQIKRAGLVSLIAAAAACGGDKQAEDGARTPASAQTVQNPAGPPAAKSKRELVVQVNALAREVFYTVDGGRSGEETKETITVMVGLDEPRGLVRVMTSVAAFSLPAEGGFKGGGLKGAVAEIPFGAAKASVDRKSLGKTPAGEAVKSAIVSCAGKKKCIGVSTGGAFSPSEEVASFSIACLESACPEFARRLNDLLSD